MSSCEGERLTKAVDDYANAVIDNLRGPSGARRALAHEIRDHLVDAIERRGEGRDPLEIAEATMAGFGRPQDLARRLQPGLDRANWRRTAFALLGVASGLTALWFVIFVFGPPAPWSEPAEPAMLVWTVIVGSAAMKVALVASFVAVLSGWLLPRLVRDFAIADRAHSLLEWSCRFGIGTLLIGVTTILAYTIARGLLAPGSLEWSDVTCGALATGSAMIGLGRLGKAGSLTG